MYDGSKGRRGVQRQIDTPPSVRSCCHVYADYIGLGATKTPLFKTPQYTTVIPKVAGNRL